MANANDKSSQASGKGAGKSSKRQRKEERRREARSRVLKKRALIYSALSLIILIPALWTFDRSGSEVAVDATVIQTQQYNHYNKQSGAHTHLRATLLVDGRSEQVIERADGYQRGQRVKVWVQRGRITGWPYFNDLVKPGEEPPEAEEGAEET